VYILPVSGDHDIRHRRKNEKMQHGDDAHNAEPVTSKLTRMASQSTRVGGIISRTAYNNSMSPRLVATSALELFHRVASAGKAPDANAKNARTRD
jgi:hypothetical protein